MKKISSLFLIILITSFGLKAQEKLSLSLEEAQDYALEHNKTLYNADLDIEKSERAIKEAFAGLYPQISAKADYSNYLGASSSIQFSENMPPQELKFDPTSNLSVNVGQMIFNGQFWVGLKTAKILKSITELNKEKTETDILAQVNNSYHLVLISKELLNKISVNQKNLKEVYEKTKPLVDVGMLESTEIDQLSVQVTMLENTVKKTERQLKLAKNMLKLQLGLNAETEINLTTSLDEIIIALNPEQYLNDNYDVDNNINIKLIDKQILVQEKAVDLKRASKLPTLNGFYQYSEKLLKPKFDMTPSHVLGLQLEVPIFSGFMKNAQIQQAKIEVKKTENSKSLLIDQLKTQEIQLRYDFKNALETYNNLKKNVEISRRVYQSMKNKYNQGMLSSIDLITADNSYVKAETDLITAILDLLSSKIDLDKLYENFNDINNNTK